MTNMHIILSMIFLKTQLWKNNFLIFKLISIDKSHSKLNNFCSLSPNTTKCWQIWWTCFQKCCMKQLHYISIIEGQFSRLAIMQCGEQGFFSLFCDLKKIGKIFEKISKISWIHIKNPKETLEENFSGFGGHYIGMNRYFLLTSPRTSPNLRLSPWLPPPPRPLILGTALP
jgi:hypothetical protein